MKIRSIFLTLFLSFAGVSLAGCWIFNGDSDDPGKSVDELKTEAAEYIAEANIALVDNTEKPECAEAVTAVAEAQAAVDAIISDATTQDEAKGVKSKARKAKNKAEECAKPEDESIPPPTYGGTPVDDPTASCNPSDVTSFVCKDASGTTTTLYLRLITYDTSQTDCSTESKLEQYQPENKIVCVGTSADCTKQKDELVEIKTAAGNSC